MVKIAIDVGSGLTKWKTEGASGAFPSAVGKYEFNENEFSVEDYRSDVVKIEGNPNTYLVAFSADVLLEEDQRHDTLKKCWARTTEYKALLYKAIASAFPDGYEGNAQICLGLPQRYYEEQKSGFSEAMATQHVFKVGQSRYRVRVAADDLVVMPQSMSVFFYHAIHSGEDVTEDDFCIIDVGTFTTGYSMVNSGRFNSRKSGGLELGISNFRDDLRAFIKREHGLVLSAPAVTRALVRGKMKVGKKMVKLSSVIPDLAHPLMDRLVDELDRVWGDSSQMATVLLGGGGARYVHNSLKRRWPHIELVGGEENCSMVVVEGYFGYLSNL